jgi:Xaa-Pro aminopeptidase
LIVASGKRGAYPHGVASRKKIRANEFITVDFGAVLRGYCSDETCTIFVGTPQKRQKVVYQAVKEAHDRAVETVRPGKHAREIDETARSVLKQAGLDKYFRHGTGHGVGLAIHEEPRIAPKQETVLEKDMVFTIEPGVYIPGWGGIRIEDTVRVTRGGCELLSSVPKGLMSI